MKDLSKVKRDNKGYYIEYIRKNGKKKGYIVKAYGQIREHCPICNESFFAQNSHIKRGFGEFCSHSCPVKGKNSWFYGKHPIGKFHPMYGVHRTGELAPNWQGGISNKSYPFDFNEELKELIRKRDGYVCQFPNCKEKQNGRALDVHHIDYDKNNLNPSNLITLCRIHNLKVNKNRKYWIEYFQNRGKGNGNSIFRYESKREDSLSISQRQNLC